MWTNARCIFCCRIVRQFRHLAPFNAQLGVFPYDNIDYCNSVLHRASAVHIQPLQNVLNAAVRIVLWKRKLDSITADIRDKLHWLQITYTNIPALLTSLSFSDQFAFRPALPVDFSKAFDTVRHLTLLSKYSLVNIPDNTYNWLVEYFHGHSHYTKYCAVCAQTSAMHEMTASIQGSVIGPASYVLTVVDLCSVTPGNSLCNHADDTYISLFRRQTCVVEIQR